MERLVDIFITQFAKSKGISKKQAVGEIDKCLLKVSAEQNTSYNLLYNYFYTFTSLSQCLYKQCSSSTLQECEKMCGCVIFKNKCISRFIPQASEINKDPDKWIITIKTSDLEELVERASFLYYNYEGGGLTDNSFDALEYHLGKRLKLKGRLWEKIGAEPIEKLKVNLPYPMGSLEKIKPGTSSLVSFLNQANKNGSLVWSDKLDGVSGMIVFKKGQVDGIYTRGDGTIGGNVTYLKDYIKLPTPTIPYFVVRGEFVLSKRNWDEKYKNTFSNARSFISAKINSGYISPSLPDIDFVAYSIVDWSNKGLPTPSQAFKYLQEQGFKTPVNGVFKNPILVFDLVYKYTTRRKESDYFIDGLVCSLDIETGLNNSLEHSKAFKMLLEEQIRDTQIIDIDWSIGRYGRYFPVAVFESVYIDGIRLTRASAHNAQHIVDWNMGRGTKIQVARSGDVIPTIKNVNVDKSVKAILPNETYKWHWENKDIILDDIEGNQNVQIKRLSHFFATIGTAQLGEGRIKALYDAGYQTIRDILNANKLDIQKAKRIGPKIADTLYQNIHKSMRETRLDRFFVAVTTIKSRIGRTLLKQVVRSYPNIFSDNSIQIKQYLTKNKVKGFGEKRIEMLAESIPKFMDELYKLNKQDIEYAVKYQTQKMEELMKKGYNPLIKNNKFVMTGFLMAPNYELEDYIWDNWGDISGSLTTDVKGVITGNPTFITGKMSKAVEMKIPVYTVSEFVKLFNVTGVQVKDDVSELIIGPIEPEEN